MMSQRRMIWAWDYPEPIRMSSGKAYVSRITLFEVIGWGPHQCHWCECPIEWLPKGPGALQVDHLDGDVSNDDIANLVPSCAGCNSARGKGTLWLILAYDPLLMRRALAAGPVKTHFRCGHPFVAENIYVLPEHAHSRFTCLTCRRTKAREYWRNLAA